MLIKVDKLVSQNYLVNKWDKKQKFLVKKKLINIMYLLA